MVINIFFKTNPFHLKERGWPKMTRASFDAQRGPQGALLVGDPDEVVEKIIRHSKALGGISRITFMMNPASLSHVKLMRATELIGKRVAPALREKLGGNDGKGWLMSENSNLLPTGRSSA